MDVKELLNLIRDEDRLTEFAENIKRYPNEPVMNLLDRVYPEIAEQAYIVLPDSDECPHCHSRHTERMATICDDPLIEVCQCGHCGETFEVVTEVK